MIGKFSKYLAPESLISIYFSTFVYILNHF